MEKHDIWWIFDMQQSVQKQDYSCENKVIDK